MSAVNVIGDIHGQREKLIDLMRGAGLIDAHDAWSGAESTLWFMGDLVDHGPDGIGVVELVIQLQKQASQAGGRVQVLLGNHDVLLLAAHRFGTKPIPGLDETFQGHWEECGGQTGDLEQLTPDHVRWLSGLPAMARQGDHLLVHADALLYADHGQSIAEVNRALHELIQGDDAVRWHHLLDAFGEHRAFVDSSTGAAHAESFLALFGGQQIIHGHTPVTTMTGQPPEAVREPLLYASGRCLDVDPGLYLGGKGFVYRLPSGDETASDF
ncbi:MAG TPA: metallophosphoesterase family protein [Thermomicrobiales bacterium]|nr:metallophosphoesterase family protein [Thermomicrobiales bacterium]